jgi:hypothetical protein
MNIEASVIEQSLKVKLYGHKGKDKKWNEKEYQKVRIYLDYLNLLNWNIWIYLNLFGCSYVPAYCVGMLYEHVCVHKG